MAENNSLQDFTWSNCSTLNGDIVPIKRTKKKGDHYTHKKRTRKVDLHIKYKINKIGSNLRKQGSV
jgi:hypothetical protein